MGRRVIQPRYQSYLEDMKMDESKMTPEQRKQMKNAFFAGWSDVLDLIQVTIAALPLPARVQMYEDMRKELLSHYTEGVVKLRKKK